MLNAFVEFGLVESAVQVFDQMPERNCVTYNALLAGFCHNREGSRGLEIFQWMLLNGLEISDFTLTSAMNACALVTDMKKSEQIHAFLIKSGCKLSAWIEAALLDINGQHNEALSLFQLGIVRNDLMIMDEFSYSAVLALCGTLEVGNALFSMFAKCGNLEDSITLFSQMPQHDIVSTAAATSPELSQSSPFQGSLWVGVSSSSSSDSLRGHQEPDLHTETKSLPSIGRQLLSDATKSSGTESKLHARSFADTDAVGLSIIDALNEEKSTKAFPNSESGRVVFGSLLKVRIPSLCPGSMSPVGSPIEFGVKNKESQLALLSPAQSSLGLEMTTSSSCRVFARSISMSEMELSEDYTSVISHGPNPRTTHIFDNCIVESCGDGFTASIETNSSTPTDRPGHLSNDFFIS
ncbi:hypothetical protein ZIOFF_038076 [Zingiber officinale]|uniref:Pentatricopeptide repeat-containing protein n=1 Tax=Zingiber officinale TaxID=94328 RepID=A0A8J5GFX1_ZINOF|nr:hypothetical protein ZIOFF_038076 [Zingiber officinale]